MKPVATLFILTLVATLASASCTRMGYVHLTFYGYPDNNPPSADTAYNCGGRNYTAGGTGTFDDPVTFGSAEGEFNECEIVYIPYLEKYARYEDYCAECTVEYTNNVRHINVWAGSSNASLNGGADQIVCEENLTPNQTITIIRRPDETYAVDITPFYEKGATIPSAPTPPSSSSSSPASSPTSSSAPEHSDSPQNGTVFTVQVTVDISITVNDIRKGGPKARRALVDRNEGSCSGNLYPKNDAAKICIS